MEEALDDLVVEAERMGVEIDIDIDGTDDALWISSIERTAGIRGAGARVLERLMSFCEEVGFALTGQVASDHPRLAKFYEDLGFEVRRDGERLILHYQP